MVELLTNLTSVDANVQDTYGTTPMFEAAFWGYIVIIDMLAKVGADPNLDDKEGDTPVHAAALWGYTDTVVVGIFLVYSLLSQIIYLSGFSRTWSRFEQEGVWWRHSSHSCCLLQLQRYCGIFAEARSGRQCPG